jgi:hypothetical protein
VIPGLAIGGVSVVAGGALIASGRTWIGIAVLLAGLLVAGAVIIVGEVIAMGRNIRDWVRLVRGKPDTVKVVSIAPPKGFLVRRDAVITLEVEAEAGGRKQTEQQIRIPILQAVAWRVLGRVPTPIGRLTDTRTLNRIVFKRRGTGRKEAKARNYSEGA